MRVDRISRFRSLDGFFTFLSLGRFMTERRTPLSKAQGLGSAKTGSSDWSMQRLTAVALVPLSFWMVAFIKRLSDMDYAQINIWLADPLNSLCAVSFILVAFYHAVLGLQVVIEDYVQNMAYKLTLLWIVKLGFSALAISALLSILRIITK